MFLLQTMRRVIRGFLWDRRKQLRLVVILSLSAASLIAWQKQHTGSSNAPPRMPASLHDTSGDSSPSTESVKNVILFAYMRGGSSIFSEAFISNPETQFWYEPLDAFYSGLLGQHYWLFPHRLMLNKDITLRSVPEWEHKLVAQYLTDLLSCDFRRLPTETLVHPGAIKDELKMLIESCFEMDKKPKESGNCKNDLECSGWYTKTEEGNCMNEICHFNTKFNLTWNDQAHCEPVSEGREEFKEHAKCLATFKRAMEPCIAPYARLCQAKRIRATKVIRLSMDTLNEIFNKRPDTYVIFIVRDPRAIAHSRRIFPAGYTGTGSMLQRVARGVCNRMRRDLITFKLLQQKFPSQLLLVRYEDFTVKPQNTLAAIYKLIGEIPPEVVEATILNNMFNNDTKQSYMNTVRSNATETALKWKREILKSDAEGITEDCRDVLAELNYPLEV